MDAVVVRMACGCRLSLPGGTDEPPTCLAHHEYRVQSVTAPPPRIRAVGIDPSKDLGPLVRHGV
jgi:hypothetical protein